MSSDKLRLYGVANYLRRALLALLRPVFRMETFFVLINAGFSGSSLSGASIREISSEQVEQYARNGQLETAEVAQFYAFLQEGSRGLAVEVDGVLAGYAWIQPEGGTYYYGDGGRMVIPHGYTMMKNLLVRPEYRGDGLGRILNQARLAATPVSSLPTVFIVNDNRYAIRNWEAYGFRKALSVTQQRFHNGRLRTTVKELDDFPGVAELARALREGAN